MSVDISNPKVGLVDITSSPFNRFRIVVLPALSKPLTVGLCENTNLEAEGGSQKKNSHFAFFSFVFADNCQKSHRDC